MSRASMNPARSLAPAIVSLHFTDLLIYLASPFIGTALAVPTFRFVYEEGRKQGEGL
ncbi:MAG: aquaporin [Thermodesulfobacteriota bacterium]